MDALGLSLGGLVALVVLYCLCGAARKREAEWAARFPPLSDAEYLARCAPGTDPGVALRVRAVLAEALGVEYEQIYPDARLQDDLGA